jgi:hypothetical protein
MKINSLPFTIEDCGLYTVTKCLEGVPDEHGIVITGEARDVTIDLGGYALVGVPGSQDGIHAESIAENLVVRNGTVRDWGGDGIDLTRGYATQVIGVQSMSNGGRGIATHDSAFVGECQARDNGEEGIAVERCCVIVSCTASLNGGDGIVVGKVPNINSGSVVRSSTSCFNTGVGIRLAPGCLAADCGVVQNSGGGIEAADDALIRGNAVGGTITAPTSTVIENHQY